MKKEAFVQVFSCKFCKISNNLFFLKILRRLLLIFAVDFVEIIFCYKTMIVRRKFEHDKNFFLLFCLMFNKY